MKNGRYRTGNRRHDPHPIRWTSLSRSQFVFVVFHKRFGRSVMVHYCYVVRLTRIENSHFNMPQRPTRIVSVIVVVNLLGNCATPPGWLRWEPCLFSKTRSCAVRFSCDPKLPGSHRQKINAENGFSGGEPAGFPLPSALTSNTLYLCGSHKFLHPISELMYQPLNGHAVNWIPPQSNSIPDTAGRQYHRRPKSANQSNLRVGRCHVTSH